MAEVEAMAETVFELLDSLRRGPVSSSSSLSAAAAAALAALADGLDRISALPDEILHDVVARLPVRDTARTAALASRWRGMWRSAPLVLSDTDLLGGSPIDAVGRILADHPGPFRKVQLTFCRFESRERLLEWSRILADKGVEDLVLVDNPDLSAALERRLPADILRCASARRLFLGAFTFPDTAGAPRGADVFPRLNELSLLSTNTSEQDLEKMVACSPQLKTLSLILCLSLERVRLHSQSIQCMLLWITKAEDIAVVDAPCLERLILWTSSNVGGDMTVKIVRAPMLRVLGYLETGVQLQIGGIVIKAETKASPRSTVPSVNTLALKVKFGVFKEVNMLPSFLRCFPNIETLHIESAVAAEATGKHHAKFWQEACPVECVNSKVKKIVVHEFRGERCEFEFLKFIAKHAQKLQALLLVLSKETIASVDAFMEVHLKMTDLGKCT